VTLATDESPRPAEANQLFEKACSGGIAAACSNLAMSYRTGFGVERDDKRAAALFKQACDGGHLLGCRNLGLAHLTGDGVAVDAARARELFGFACASGLDLACTNFAMALRDGVGGDKDVERAVQVFSKACTGDAAACRHLGAMYAAGQGLVASSKSAELWFARACDGGDSSGCLALGMLRLQEKPDLARKALEAACAQREQAACEIMVKKGWATRRDQTGDAAKTPDAGP
jgi:TPR repeat protein